MTPTPTNNAAQGLGEDGPRWWATWVAGPDCGATTPLEPGERRWIVGRSAATAVGCGDPALAPHHAVIEMCPAGAAPGGATREVPRVVVLAAPPPSGRTGGVQNGTTLGRSVLVVHRSAPPPAVERLAGVVQRRARPRRPVPDPPREPDELTRPDRGGSSLDDTNDTAGAPAGLALVSSVVGLVVALAMAVVLHQPMFAWFALSGAVVALAGWATQRWWARRARRRREAARLAAHSRDAAAVRRFEEEMRLLRIATTPTVVRAWHTVVHHDRHLWERRPADGDALVVGLGLTDTLDTSSTGRTDGTQVAVDLAEHRRVAVRGPHAVAVTRALVLQLVAQCGPADLRVVVVDEPRGTKLHASAEPDRLPASIDRLPHGLACTPDDLSDLLAHETQPTESDGHRRHVVVVTALAEHLGVRTSALRRALDAHPEIVLLCTSGGPPPLSCTSEIVTDDDGSWWTPDRSVPHARERAMLAGVGAERWSTAVASIHWLVDPEDDETARRLPDLVPAHDVMPLDPDTLAEQWNASTDGRPRAVLGTASDGLVAIDLVRDGPHALVVGTTGSGKSDLLRTLVLGMAVASPPDRVQFVLIDFKGGAAFDACARLPHVVGLVTDLDRAGCERVLRSLRAELRRREGVLRAAGVSDAGDLHGSGVEAAHEVPRLVVVVDEFAALADELPHVLHSLVDIARRGRSLGVHLVLATQRASGALSDDIRANTSLRIALRLHDHGESRDVVGDESAARLPRRVAGRAVMRLGDDERITFQTAFCTPVLSAAVDTITAVAANQQRHPRRRPWCDPLPTLITTESVGAVIGADDGADSGVDSDDTDDPPTVGDAFVVGVVDDTDGQRRRPLRWTPDSGALLLLGGGGTGLTSALRTIARAITSSGSTRPCLVVDPSLDELALHRVLGTAAVDPTAVLLVDRLDLVRGRLEREGRDLHLEMLVHALTRQQVVVVATSTLAAVPSAFLPRCTVRWATHLHDPLELGGVGLRADDNPPPIAGRIVIGGSGPECGLSAQLIIGPTADDAPTVTDGRGLARARTRHDSGALVIGRDLATGADVELCLEDGEHVVVSGGRRTGRTTALAALASAWPGARADGVVVGGEGLGLDRHSRSAVEALVAEASEFATSRPTLLVIDDAESIDDDDGALRALLDARLPRLTVAIAVHPGALRGRYGHWTHEVRRHRTGLALLGADDDGDTWGVVLPRRLPLAPAPGRALVIRHGIVDESLGPRIIEVGTTRSFEGGGRGQRRTRRQ